MSLSELWPYLRDLAALAGAAFVLVTYRHGQRQRRAEWLDGLYARFYEQPQYKRIRRILDYDLEPEMSTLKSDVLSGTASDLHEELVDYLNFFEFLGSLSELGQITEEEISMLFEYYLSRMNDHDFLVLYVKANGFERLERLLLTRRRSAPSPRDVQRPRAE